MSAEIRRHRRRHHGERYRFSSESAVTKPLTTSQAAALLDLSPSQTTRLAAAGRIPGASKPSRDWVFAPPIEILPPARPPGWPRRRPPAATG